MENHHFQDGVGSVEPLGHDSLEEVLSLEFLIFLGESEFEGGENLVHHINIVVHASIGEFADGVHDELSEGSLKRLTFLVHVIGFPFLVSRVEEVVTPEFLHHFILVDVELLGVDSSELGEGESPAFFS